MSSACMARNQLFFLHSQKRIHPPSLGVGWRIDAELVGMNSDRGRESLCMCPDETYGFQSREMGSQFSPHPSVCVLCVLCVCVRACTHMHACMYIAINNVNNGRMNNRSLIFIFNFIFNTFFKCTKKKMYRPRTKTMTP